MQERQAFCEGATSHPLRKALIMSFRGEMSERITFRANGVREQYSHCIVRVPAVCNRAKYDVFHSIFSVKNQLDDVTESLTL